MVLGQGYRNPALVAKMVATLQVLSSGRFVLGIGAGWQQDEYIACDFPCPSAGHPDRAAWRGDRPDEVVEGVSPGGQPVRVYVLPGTTIPPTPASQDTSARLLGRSHGAPRAESGARLVPGSGRVSGFHPFSPRRDHGRLRVSQLSLTDRAASRVGAGLYPHLSGGSPKPGHDELSGKVDQAPLMNGIGIERNGGLCQRSTVQDCASL